MGRPKEKVGEWNDSKHLTVKNKTYWQLTELRGHFKKNNWEELIDFIYRYKDKLKVEIH